MTIAASGVVSMPSPSSLSKKAQISMNPKTMRSTARTYSPITCLSRFPKVRPSMPRVMVNTIKSVVRTCSGQSQNLLFLAYRISAFMMSR